MRRHVSTFLSVVVFLSTACSGPATSSLGVYDNPAGFVGQKVRVCGYIRDEPEDRQIWPSHSAYKKSASGSNTRGLGFLSKAASSGAARGPLHDKTGCVTATIIRTGCATDKICLWSDYDYAAKEVSE
jgi:hypothetical protein